MENVFLSNELITKLINILQTYLSTIFANFKMTNQDYYEVFDYDHEVYYGHAIVGPIFRDRNNPIDWYTHHEFLNRYRMSKESMNYVLQLIMTSIQRPTRRRHALPAVIQLCITIRFYCTGSYQAVLGDFVGVHRVQVHRVQSD